MYLQFLTFLCAVALLQIEQLMAWLRDTFWAKCSGAFLVNFNRSSLPFVEEVVSLHQNLIGQSLKTHTPQIRGVKIHPPNLGGESSKITCFTALFGVHSPEIRGVKSSPPKFGGGYGSSGMLVSFKVMQNKKGTKAS